MKVPYTIFLASCAFATPLESQSERNRTAVVDLAVTRGPAQQLASGVLYGTPDVPDQIPDYLYTGPKLKYFRAGGAQLFNVGERGWHWNEYKPRFQSTLSNYRTARKYHGEFQILPHDIWATDTVNDTTKWPGDDGDWTSYDAFLDQLMHDLKANHMVPGLKLDIWNEADYQWFWKRSTERYLELWKRTYLKFRADKVLKHVPIIGPSFATSPGPNNAWWNAFMPYIVANNVIPDEYTLHVLGNSSDPSYDIQNIVIAMDKLFAQYGAPPRPYSVNEYINSYEDRMNAAFAWYIGRLERYNASGLRANWLGGLELHDYLAELVYRPNEQSEYKPNGAWHLYTYYAQKMVGTRYVTSGSKDSALDVFATRSPDKTVRILAGVRAKTGKWEVEVKNLKAIGLPKSGKIKIQTWGFDDVGPRGVSKGPSNRGVSTIKYKGGVLTIPINQTGKDAKTAWAFEFKR